MTKLSIIGVSSVAIIALSLGACAKTDNQQHSDSVMANPSPNVPSSPTDNAVGTTDDNNAASRATDTGDAQRAGSPPITGSAKPAGRDTSAHSHRGGRRPMSGGY